jgi:hypothetical protein
MERTVFHCRVRIEGCAIVVVVVLLGNRNPEKWNEYDTNCLCSLLVCRVSWYVYYFFLFFSFAGMCDEFFVWELY